MSDQKQTALLPAPAQVRDKPAKPALQAKSAKGLFPIASASVLGKRKSAKQGFPHIDCAHKKRLKFFLKIRARSKAQHSTKYGFIEARRSAWRSNAARGRMLQSGARCFAAGCQNLGRKECSAFCGECSVARKSCWNRSSTDAARTEKSQTT